MLITDSPVPTPDDTLNCTAVDDCQAVAITPVPPTRPFNDESLVPALLLPTTVSDVEPVTGPFAGTCDDTVTPSNVNACDSVDLTLPQAPVISTADAMSPPLDTFSLIEVTDTRRRASAALPPTRPWFE